MSVQRLKNLFERLQNLQMFESLNFERPLHH